MHRITTEEEGESLIFDGRSMVLLKFKPAKGNNRVLQSIQDRLQLAKLRRLCILNPTFQGDTDVE